MILHQREPVSHESHPVWTDAFVALGFCALALLVWGPVLRWNLNLGDEGWLVTGVQRLVDGESLYVDFQRSYAPAVYWIRVPLFRLFGESVVVARALSLAELAAVAGLAYLVPRPHVPRWAAAGCALLPIVLRTHYHKMFVPLTLVAGLWLCKQLVTRPLRGRRVFLVGCGLGLVGLWRQEIAAYSVLIACLTILVVSFRDARAEASGRGDAARASSAARAMVSLAVLGAGAATPWIPFVASLALEGGLGVAFEQLVLLGVRGNRAMDIDYPRLSTVVTGPHRLVTSLFYAPALAALVALFVVARAAARERLRTPQLLLAQWALMSLLVHSVFAARSDYSHLEQVLLAPAFVLAYAIDALWRGAGPRLRSRRLLAAGLGLWALAVLVEGGSARLTQAYRGMHHGVRLDEPRAPVVLPARQAKRLVSVLAELRERVPAGQPLFSAPHVSMLPFIVDRPNPLPYDSLWPGFGSEPAVQRRVVRGLEEHGVATILVHDLPRVGREEWRFPGYAPLLEAYLDEHFVEDERLGMFVFLARR